MSANPTSIIRPFAAIGTIIASLALAGVASASEPVATQLSGNPTCADIDLSFTEVKVDNPRAGRTDFDGGSLDIKGLYLDWSAPAGVDVVIVKGGDGANVYRADDEMTGGVALHAPVNGDNGKPAGISHVNFCSDGVDGPARGRAAGAPCESATADGRTCDAARSESAATQPQGEVLAAHAEGGRTPASAQMSAPGACVKGAYAQVVRGNGIRRVTFSVNGRTLRTFAGSRSRYAVTINPNAFRGGVMRLQARVVFAASTERRPRTLRMTVLRCARAAAQQAPAFAG